MKGGRTAAHRSRSPLPYGVGRFCETGDGRRLSVQNAIKAIPTLEVA
jgi:hypothetical protein